MYYNIKEIVKGISFLEKKPSKIKGRGPGIGFIEQSFKEVDKKKSIGINGSQYE